MNINKSHFVFDLDDTITDSYDFNQQIFVEVFSPYVDIKNPEIEKYLRTLHYTSKGRSMIEQFTEAVKHLSISVDPYRLLVTNEKVQTKKAGKMKIFNAVEDLVKLLKSKGKDISIMSNRQTDSLRKIIKTNKLTKYFSNIVSCTDSGHEKPDPYCLNKLVAESKLEKKDFIYFGDSRTDYEFASSAGIDFVIIDHYLNQKMFYKMILQSFIN